MVDVTKDRDHGRAMDQEFRGRFLRLKRVEHVVFGSPFVDNFKLDSKLQRKHLRGLIIERSVDTHELTHVGHHALDQIISSDPNGFRKASKGDGRLDLGVRLTCWCQCGAVTSLGLATASAFTALLVGLVQQSRRGHR